MQTDRGSSYSQTLFVDYLNQIYSTAFAHNTREVATTLCHKKHVPYHVMVNDMPQSPAMESCLDVRTEGMRDVAQLGLMNSPSYKLQTRHSAPGERSEQNGRVT